jgi:hypothetical protein
MNETQIERVSSVPCMMFGHQGYLSYIVDSSGDNSGTCYLFQYAPMEYVSPSLDTQVGLLFWSDTGNVQYLTYDDNWREVYAKERQ